MTEPAPGRPGPEGSVLFTASWGSGKEQLGRLSARESNPEAPMSLSVDRQGTVYVLDMHRTQEGVRILQYSCD